MNINAKELKGSVNKINDLENLIVVLSETEILADLDTPVSAFYKLCNNKSYSFLLESVEENEKLGRYSLIGTEPVLVFTSKDNKTYLEEMGKSKVTQLNDNPFSALKTILKGITLNTENDFIGFTGYFGYENIRWIEPKTKFTQNKTLPDVCLIFPGKLVIFDHILHKVKLISIAYTEDESKSKLKSLLKDFNKPAGLQSLSLNYSNEPKTEFTSNISKDDFIKKVKAAKDYIKSGDIFQVVLSQKLKLKGTHNGFSLYRALRSINPSPYLFYLKFPDFEIAGSSPEVMVKSECKSKGKGKNKIASLRPIAGTYPRGKDEDEDLNYIQRLLNDPKEKAEHLMLVDLARNDLGRVCEAGSVNVPELMVIEKYSHVLHMVSQVEGILKNDKTSIDLLCACFPAGTLSGAPKVRALEIINELEGNGNQNQRGPYGGCIGFFGLKDTINTCMTIRTFIVFKDYIEIQAGAGIVADSIPENEYNETLRKGAALLKAASLIG